MVKEHLVQVGVITGARGIRGEVWISSYTADPAAIADYGPLFDAAGGNPLNVRIVQAAAGGRVAARVAGVADRSQAEALTGRALFAPRTAFPAPAEGEFYHADLIGLRAIDESGAPVGSVIALHNHGAGDVIEIAPDDGPSFMLPFTRTAVPRIDVAAGEIVVELPDGWLDASAPPVDDAEAGNDDAPAEMTAAGVEPGDAAGALPPMGEGRPAARRRRSGAVRGARRGRR
jgi:16S rRNA processing protein RimM